MVGEGEGVEESAGEDGREWQKVLVVCWFGASCRCAERLWCERER